MLFSWFDGREANQFGLSMADFFAKRIPPEAIPATEKKPLGKPERLFPSCMASYSNSGQVIS